MSCLFRNSNFNFFAAKCDNCGRLGVKRTFQVKKKNFCSLSCSKAMGKRGDATLQVQTILDFVFSLSFRKSNTSKIVTKFFLNNFEAS